MTITQLPFAVCQNCQFEFIATKEQLKFYFVECPNCGFRNTNANAKDSDK